MAAALAVAAVALVPAGCGPVAEHPDDRAAGGGAPLVHGRVPPASAATWWCSPILPPWEESSPRWPGRRSEGLTFSMVGGGGPGIIPSRAGPERPGFNVLARASLPLSPPPMPTAANLARHPPGTGRMGSDDRRGTRPADLATYNQRSARPLRGRPVHRGPRGAARCCRSKAWVWNITCAAPRRRWRCPPQAPSPPASVATGHGVHRVRRWLPACCSTDDWTQSRTR